MSETFDFRSIKFSKEYESTEFNLSIIRLSDTITQISEKLTDCRHFHFLDKDKIIKLLESNEDYSTIEYQLNRLLILSIKCSCHSLSKIIESILFSNHLNNEIMLAFSVRAIIEHVCIFDDLVFTIESNFQEKSNRKNQKPEPDEVKAFPEIIMMNEFIRFVIGSRIVFQNEMPSEDASNKQWEKYLKDIQNVPEHLTSKNVLTCIDKFGKRYDLRRLRIIYDILSEFVHPNSSSRMFRYNRNDIDGSYFIEENAESTSDCFLQIFNLSTQIVPYTVDINISNLEKMIKYLMPMKEPENSKRGEHGKIKQYDHFGREIWIDSKQISTESMVKVPLSDDQIKRLKAIKKVFSEFDKKPFDEFVKNIQKSINPEVEIRIYEHLAKVYEFEIKERKNCAYKKRKKLYTIIIGISLGFSKEKFASEYTWFSAFDNFERVRNRILSCEFIHASRYSK